MTLERAVATYNFKTYERAGMNCWGIFLVAAQWFLPVSSVCFIVLNADWSEMKVPVTMTSARTTAIISNMNTSMAIVELVSLGILFGLLRYNAKKRKELQEASLTEKYQVDENLRSIRLMIPMVITHFCCFMPSLVAFPLYYAIDPSADPRQYAIFLETFGTTILYSVLLPIVLFWRHKILRETLRKSMGIFDHIEPQELRADGRTREQMRHFQLLSSVWEREITPKGIEAKGGAIKLAQIKKN
uniref:G-protein coupled receptors family 1 profile domain-containing protein n=1 Tax=Plectus sambesii TaxID=2011161 RepID=A0A914WJS8_9BILA